MSSVIKILRNNWKKSVFFSCCGVYGSFYLKDVYRDSLIRTAYCKKAEKFGREILQPGQSAKKVTVFLNPAANKGKAKKLFDKNAAPLLYLAGFEVKIVKTEYEGQAKQYMDVLDNTDVVIAAGGDGTLLEVVTGLLRKQEEKRNVQIPVGVIPIGKTNRFAKKLYPKGKSDARWLMDAAMAVVLDNKKSVDVMKLKSSEEKTAFSVSGLEWGPFREAKSRAKKYWYVGGLKQRWSYLMSTFSDWPPLVTADITYTTPCTGCSRCYKPPQKPQWRWWHILLPPRPVVTVDYSGIINEECGKVYEDTVSTMDFTLSVNDEHIQEDGVRINTGPTDMQKSSFIKEGWRRIATEARNCEDSKDLFVSTLTLKPNNITKGSEGCFDVDSEEYEPMSLDVEYLKDKIQVFYGSSLLEYQP